MKQFTKSDWRKLRDNNYEAYREQYWIIVGRVSHRQPLSSAEWSLLRVATAHG